MLIVQHELKCNHTIHQPLKTNVAGVNERSESNLSLSKFYVVRTVYFGMKLYIDQRNAQVFNLFIYLLLPYMFRAFF
jgi:hypothetical protein